MKADYKRQIVEELEDIPEEDLSKIQRSTNGIAISANLLKYIQK